MGGGSSCLSVCCRHHKENNQPSYCLPNNVLEVPCPVTEVLLKNRRNNWIQLAGHPGNFSPAGPKSIWKRNLQGDDNEARCLRALMCDPIRDVVPKFYREIVYNESLYVEMEDLLRNFRDPNVMDVKIGTRTFQESEVKNPSLRHDLYEKMVQINAAEPTAEENEQKAITKLRYMQFREAGSSSALLGFRIEAIRQSGEVPSTDFKKVRTKEDVSRTISQFVGGQASVCKRFIRRLREIQRLFEASPFFRHHEIIGSSLLFVYDYEKHANVWMIDFAKTTHVPDVQLTHRDPWKLGNHEDGYLIGLDGLIQILTELCV